MRPSILQISHSISRKLSSKTTAANPSVLQQKLTPPHSLAFPLPDSYFNQHQPVSLLFDQNGPTSLQRRHNCNYHFEMASFSMHLLIPFSVFHSVVSFRPSPQRSLFSVPTSCLRFGLFFEFVFDLPAVGCALPRLFYVPAIWLALLRPSIALAVWLAPFLFPAFGVALVPVPPSYLQCGYLYEFMLTSSAFGFVHLRPFSVPTVWLACSLLLSFPVLWHVLLHLLCTPAIRLLPLVAFLTCGVHPSTPRLFIHQFSFDLLLLITFFDSFYLQSWLGFFPLTSTCHQPTHISPKTLTNSFHVRGESATHWKAWRRGAPRNTSTAHEAWRKRALTTSVSHHTPSSFPARPRSP